MKTLYIHGLDSFPVPEKLEILKNAGLEVVAPHLDYRAQPDTYPGLKRMAVEEKVEFLVGSSLGGYLAYWLAEDLGLPCLLFNPAMSYDDLFRKHLPEIENRLCPARFVVIGANDETADPIVNRQFFRKADDGHCYQRVVVCDWLRHQIDFASFEEMVSWAMKAYALYKKKSDR